MSGWRAAVLIGLATLALLPGAVAAGAGLSCGRLRWDYDYPQTGRYTVELRNRGAGPARNIELEVTFPSPQRISFRLHWPGPLAAGASVRVPGKAAPELQEATTIVEADTPDVPVACRVLRHE